MSPKRRRNAVFVLVALLEGLALFACAWMAAFYGWETATPQNSERVERIAFVFTIGSMVMVAVLMGTAAVWISKLTKDRRDAIGKCAQCGYDLAGLKSDVCPECGPSKR